ncbi:hypothetical protein [Azospirillum doebereinerae]
MILPMFGVGLHVSLSGLMKVRMIEHAQERQADRAPGKAPTAKSASTTDSPPAGTVRLEAERRRRTPALYRAVDRGNHGRMSTRPPPTGRSARRSGRAA